MRITSRHLLSAVLFLTALSACQPAAETRSPALGGNPPTATIALAPLVTTPDAAHTPAAFSVIAPGVGITPTPTPPIAAHDTPQAQAIMAPPTATVATRRSVTDSLLIAKGLVRGNSSCRLPCVIGTLPGVTRWPVAQLNLERFLESIDASSVDTELGRDNFRAWADLPTERYYATAYFRFLWGNETDLHVSHEVKQNVVQESTLWMSHYGGAMTGTLEALSMSHLLSEYGPPDEVWVSSVRPIKLQRDFTVILFYGRRGFYAAYQTYATPMPENDKFVEGCLHEAIEIRMRMWDPGNRPHEFRAFMKTVSRVEDFRAGGYPDDFRSQFPNYLPIREATGTSVDEFYREFRNANPQWCLKTPRKLWQ